MPPRDDGTLVTEQILPIPLPRSRRNAGARIAARHAPCGARGGRFSGNGCGRRWRRSRPRSDLFLAVSWLGLWLWLPPLGRAVGLMRLVGVAAIAALVPFGLLRVPGCDRWPAPARSRQRPAPSPGDRDRRRARGHARRIRIRWRCGTPMSSARCRRRARFKSGWPAPRMPWRDPYALRALVLIACIATFRRRRRRALEAHRRGVRLAGRGAAGEFPRRCLGDAARLYRQAADHACRHPSRRDGGSVRQPRARSPCRSARR